MLFAGGDLDANNITNVEMNDDDPAMIAVVNGNEDSTSELREARRRKMREKRRSMSFGSSVMAEINMFTICQFFSCIKHHS